MWFCVRKTARWGPGDLTPKPQDACALPKRLFMGRPKASSLRDIQLKLNLTAAEYECIVRRAKVVGMRPTHYSRAVVLDKGAARAVDRRAPSNADRVLIASFINAGLWGFAYCFPEAADAVLQAARTAFASSTPYAEGTLALTFMVFVWVSPVIVIGGIVWLAFSLLASMTASEVQRRQQR